MDEDRRGGKRLDADGDRMSAIDWRAKMRHAPKLVHDNDLSIIQLGEDVVLFPSEADTRFFYEAYSIVPQLEAEVAHLRTQIDEGALNKALTQVVGLSDDVVRLTREIAVLQAQNATLAEKAAAASVRAKILAHAVKNGIKP